MGSTIEDVTGRKSPPRSVGISKSTQLERGVSQMGRCTCRTSISQSYAEFYAELRRSYGEKAGLEFPVRKVDSYRAAVANVSGIHRLDLLLTFASRQK